MSNPRRLLVDETTGLERRLLRSWKTDRPSPLVKAAARAGFVAAASTAATSKAAAGAALKGASVPKAVVGGSLGLLKAAGATIVATAAIAGGMHLATSPAVPASSPAHVRSVTSPAIQDVSPPADAVTTIAVSALPAAPSSPPASSASATGVRGLGAERRAVRARAEAEAETPATEVATPAARASIDLGSQVAAIDVARAALARGNASGCLSALDDYDRSYPGGLLEQEATLLRLEALLQRQERAKARDVAARFIASHPGSPHIARVRRLLDTNP